MRASRSSWRRRPPPPPLSLPADCLLHVFLCLELVSVVRCAAVSKHWRRAVIDNASEIRRRLKRHSDSWLLWGLHYQVRYPGELVFSQRSSWLPPAGRQWQWHWSESEVEGTKTTKLLASGEGLLLLCRGLPSVISVVNPLTGFYTSMPRLGELFAHHRILHSCHGAKPNSFQVLAVDVSYNGVLALENYCSETGAWGPVFHPNADELRLPTSTWYRADPLVCQGTVHLLCSNVSDYALGERHFKSITHIVAVDMTSGQANMTRLPESCSMRNRDARDGKMLMLATSEGNRLSLVRLHKEEASPEVRVWLYVGDDHAGGDDDDPEKSWLLQHLLNIRELIEDAGLLSHYELGREDWSEIRLERFCPGSRCVIISIHYFGMLVLDPKSEQIQRAAWRSSGHIWPYEIDLTLGLCSMKSF